MHVNIADLRHIVTFNTNSLQFPLNRFFIKIQCIAKNENGNSTKWRVILVILECASIVYGEEVVSLK